MCVFLRTVSINSPLCMSKFIKTNLRNQRKQKHFAGTRRIITVEIRATIDDDERETSDNNRCREVLIGQTFQNFVQVQSIKKSADQSFAKLRKLQNWLLNIVIKWSSELPHWFIDKKWKFIYLPKGFSLFKGLNCKSHRCKSVNFVGNLLVFLSFHLTCNSYWLVFKVKCKLN